MSGAPAPGLVLRRAGASDLDDVVRCAERAYEGYVAAIGRRPAPMDAPFVRQIAAGEVTVALLDGQLAGYIVSYPRGDHVHVENLAVPPQLQGRGIGRRLLDHVEKGAQALGCAAIELYTNGKMTANIAWYGALGYVETGRGEQEGFRRVHFRKALPPIPGRSGGPG